MATATVSSHATHSFKNAIALITGANKGIGFETARQLGKQRIIVLIAARDKVRGEEAVKKLKQEKINAKFIHLDVTNQELIKKAAEQIQQEYGKLDILINNAAVHIEGEPPSKTTMEKLRQTFETNFFGVFAVTQAFIPLLQKSTVGGRIVNVSSQLASFGNNLADRNKLAYSTSKTALNMMTYQFAKEFANNRSTIKINSVDPGSTQTDMTGNNAKFGPVQVAADPIVYFATLPSDGPSGQFFDPKKQPHPW
ncbi:unnamed protein product [Rotaria sp. Silwood1]|nr:unnamed protein product [Rotaria sp. Silwood1]CAF1504589.1 unnamed protein product [Rotaria sp. Silwood1]CAF1505222.1 unnamed protein product [Rotaria sp. Silwood1]CAF3627017.1 unnamed protein product [Rotaria sp. Silwood1]CAF3676529.1 unnamed protein product [Rotaria sp. Silwood1]